MELFPLGHISSQSHHRCGVLEWTLSHLSYSSSLWYLIGCGNKGVNSSTGLPSGGIMNKVLRQSSFRAQLISHSHFLLTFSTASCCPSALVSIMLLLLFPSRCLHVWPSYGKESICVLRGNPFVPCSFLFFPFLPLYFHFFSFFLFPVGNVLGHDATSKLQNC